MTRTVELLDMRVRDELETLAVDVRARFRRIVELIQTYGLEQMREPHMKHLEGRLWEMRMKGKDGISRAIYVRHEAAAWLWFGCLSRRRKRRREERLA